MSTVTDLIWRGNARVQALRHTGTHIIPVKAQYGSANPGHIAPCRRYRDAGPAPYGINNSYHYYTPRALTTRYRLTRNPITEKNTTKMLLRTKNLSPGALTSRASRRDQTVTTVERGNAKRRRRATAASPFRSRTNISVRACLKALNTKAMSPG